MFDKNNIIKELNLLHYGGKGWMRGQNCSCPDCGHNDKFGIMFTKDSGIVSCMRCQYSNSLYNYLGIIDREDLRSRVKNYSLSFKIDALMGEEEQKDNKSATKHLPLGFKRIYYDEYLDSRGFLPHQYNQYNVGVCNENRLKNYLVFAIFRDNKCVGWLARSKYTKEWHEKNLKAFKEGEEDLRLRYINSTKTDFDHILLGEEELVSNTHTVLLVEGLFDKANVDNQLKLYKTDEVKCCCTFGNSVSQVQQEILRDKGIEDIILMYDYGTIKQNKKYGLELANYFNVLVGEFRDKDIDAGDADKKYLENIITNSKDFFYIYNYRINELKLK